MTNDFSTNKYFEEYKKYLTLSHSTVTTFVDYLTIELEYARKTIDILIDKLNVL